MKRIFFVGITIVLTLCLAGCGAVDKVIDCIQEGDLQQAEDIYADKISGDFEKRYDLEEALDTYLNQLYENLNAGKVTLPEAKTSVYTAQALSFAEDHQGILSELTALMISKENYEIALAQLESGDDNAAYTSFGRVIPEDSTYEVAQEKRNEVLSDAMRTVYAEIEELMNNGQFWEATDLANQIRVSWGDSEFLQSVRDLIYSRWEADDIAQAWQLAQSGDYANAIDALYEAHEAFNKEIVSEEISNAYLEIVDTWAQSALAEAENAFGESRDYEAAINILQESGCPDAKIDSAIENYQSYAPVMLNDLGYTKKGSCIMTGVGGDEYRTDMNGHTYEPQCVIYPYWGSGLSSYELDEAYITYYLGGEYRELKAILFRPYTSLSVADNAWESGTTANIYADGRLIYEGPQITPSTYEEYSIQLDITGVRELKIVLIGCWIGKYSTNYPMVCMANAQVCK